MESKDLTALFEIVRAALNDAPQRRVEAVIFKAHNGRLESFVTNENLHLFRRYRNSVSSSPAKLVSDARKARV